MALDLLTRDEVAKRVRISRRFLDMQIAAGEGPAVVRIGKVVRVSTDELHAWVERRTVRPVVHEAA